MRSPSLSIRLGVIAGASCAPVVVPGEPATVRADLEDLLAWEADPVDLDGDTSATDADRRYLGAYLRWTEAQDITSP